MAATSAANTEAFKKTPHQMRIKMCPKVKGDFRDWCAKKGFGTGGMTQAITIAMRRRNEVRRYAEFSFAAREAETTLAIDVDPDLFRDFESWCSEQAVSISSVIRGWIDHRDAIAPYIQPRTDSLESELHRAQQVLKDAEKILGCHNY